VRRANAMIGRLVEEIPFIQRMKSYARFR